MPKPQEGESQDEFVSRCIPIVIDEGTAEDGSQAAAICHSIWGDHLKNKNTEGSYNLYGVEIFSVGTWWGSMGPMKFTDSDLISVVEATTMLINGSEEYSIDPKLKIGHDPDQFWEEAQIIENQYGHAMDGDPRLGTITNFRIKGTGENTKIVADFIDLVPIIYRALVGKLYTNVSAELDFSRGIGWFISAVALLGADIPAVKKLDDLQAYLSEHGFEAVNASKSVQLLFSEPVIKGDQMPDPVKDDKTKTVDPAVQKIIDDKEKLSVAFSEQKKEALTLKTKNEAQEAELAKYRKQNCDFQFSQQKDKILAPYKKDVEDKKLMPAVFDKITACLDSQQASFKEDTILSLTPDLVREISQAYAEAVPSKQQGHHKSTETTSGDGAPDEILANECKVIMNQNPHMTYTEAANHIQITKPQVWTDYLKWQKDVSDLGRNKPISG